MPDWIVKYWAQWLFGIIATGFGGIVAYVRSKFKRLTAMEKALQASLYDRLYYLHGKYMKQGWISVQDLENVTGIYEGYHGLGGNGIGTKLYNDLVALPNFPPIKPKEK